MEKALDETLEDAEFLQVDGINDSAFERPGKVEVVTGEKAEGETDGSGGWILVGRKTDDPRQIQRKARKEVETRWPNMIKFYGGGDYGVDFIMRMLGEAEEGYLEVMKEELDWKEKKRVDIDGGKKTEKMSSAGGDDFIGSSFYLCRYFIRKKP